MKWIGRGIERDIALSRLLFHELHRRSSVRENKSCQI